MHRHKTPKVSYKKVDADSGYLSDLVDRSRESDEATAKLLVSSCSSDRSRELFMDTFDDTEWDTIATGAELGVINRRCNKLAKQVRKPTRFPITPLKRTLARARAKAKMRCRRSTFESDESASICDIREPAVVDGCGRTRAAAKKAAAVKYESRQFWGRLDEVQQKTSTTRKSCQEQHTGQYGTVQGQ